MAGYKHFCRYCDQLIPGDSNHCPLCGKKNPLGSPKCPKCKSPIQKAYLNCSNCGLSLKIICPKCNQTTFFGDYCQNCDSPLVITCSNPRCKTEQPPIGEKCIKCGKPLKG